MCASKNTSKNTFVRLFSSGDTWINEKLQKHTRRRPSSDFFLVSKKLYKQIEKCNQEIESLGLPSHLALAYVHPHVKTGVFLKPSSAPIRKGSFIGVYTGVYELVPGDLTTGTAYCYDVAQGVRLKKADFIHVSYRKQLSLSEEDCFSIQTNALQDGNFTRFINHSSLEPNVEAVVSKLPGGRVEILLFALRSIKPGEQLLSNYGGSYWRALGVIPNDMTPSTYKLSKEGKSVLQKKIVSLSLPLKKLLIPLRYSVASLPEDLVGTSLLRSLKKKLPSLSIKLKKEVDAFEELVLEKGIPRHFVPKGSIKNFRVILKKGEKTLPAGSFLGTMAGTFSSSLDKKHLSFPIASSLKNSLFLQTHNLGNFFSYLPQKKEGNLLLSLAWDTEEKLPIILVLAAKDIRPQEELCFSKPLGIDGAFKKG